MGNTCIMNVTFFNKFVGWFFVVTGTLNGLIAAFGLIFIVITFFGLLFSLELWHALLVLLMIIGAGYGYVLLRGYYRFVFNLLPVDKHRVLWMGTTVYNLVLAVLFCFMADGFFFFAGFNVLATVLAAMVLIIEWLGDYREY